MSEQQFGRYSLLRRLSQDAFGSVYRAGVVAGGGVAELVLLRTFDIPSSELEGVEERLHAAPAGGGTPSLPTAIDKGVIDGTPYLVYRYASGRTMRDLMQETGKRNAVIPVEHALFLVHRVCKATESHSRASGSSGIVFPETLYLSNDGDIQILARELAGEPITALARSMGLSTYLAPEARDGQAVANDDVFAMAALLREMLGDSTPDEVRTLIDDGTAGSGERSSLETWLSSLEKIIFARPDSSSAFNVAFFLNGLLINEIEEDARRIEAEKTALGTSDIAEDEEKPEKSEKATQAATVQAPPAAMTASADKGATGIPKSVLLAAGIGVLALLGFLGWSMLNSSDPATEELVADQRSAISKEAATNEAADNTGAVDQPVEAGSIEGAASTSEGTASQPPAAAAAGSQARTQPAAARPLQSGTENGALKLNTPSRYNGSSATGSATEPLPEPPLSDTELQAQMDLLARKKSAELEAKMREEYELQMAELQARLDEAEEERKRQEAEALAAQQAEEERKRLEAEAEAARKAEEERLAQEEAAKAAAEAAKAKPGDLVSEGPGVTTATMTKKPNPVFPRMAQRMGRSATVTVRVLVDENGQVEKAELSGDKAGFGFDDAALHAARDTEWKPATKDGVNVKIWKSLRIVFDPSG